MTFKRYSVDFMQSKGDDSVLIIRFDLLIKPGWDINQAGKKLRVDLARYPDRLAAGGQLYLDGPLVCFGV